MLSLSLFLHDLDIFCANPRAHIDSRPVRHNPSVTRASVRYLILIEDEATCLNFCLLPCIFFQNSFSSRRKLTVVRMASIEFLTGLCSDISRFPKGRFEDCLNRSLGFDRTGVEHWPNIRINYLDIFREIVLVCLNYWLPIETFGRCSN